MSINFQFRICDIKVIIVTGPYYKIIYFKNNFTHTVLAHSSTQVKLKIEQARKTYSFSNLGARWSGWSPPRIALFFPGKEPVLFVQGFEWDIWPVWASAKKLAPNLELSPGLYRAKGVATPNMLYLPTLSTNFTQDDTCIERDYKMQ